jgi:serine protease AprX
MLGLISLILTLALAAPDRLRPPSAAPELLARSQLQPAESVGVIVQKLTADRSIERRIVALGGRITAELPIVGGFAARISAGAVPIIAQDANVRWVSLDTPLVKHGCTLLSCVDSSRLATAFNQTIGADQLWNRLIPLRGAKIGVAVLDSGVNPQQELYTIYGNSRLVASVGFNDGYNQDTGDMFGHGNQIAGLIAGNGSRSSGALIGVAPEANLINVKISDDLSQGTATTSSMLDGMQWIYDHKDTYNIRVVNISLTDSVIESYNVSPLDAAAERLWQRGIVVVVAAGNGGRSSQSLAAPGNDPFVITVGAADDQGTTSPYDDTVAPWSSSGTTVDGFAKPDLVAPGVDLLAPLPVPNTYLAQTYPQNIVTTSNGSPAFRMSGTSVAAPIVAGAVALLLQDEPWLTPNQVKQRLIRTARPISGATGGGAGMLNINSAVQSSWLLSSANGGISSSAAISYLTSTVGSTAKWSTAKWSTAKWSTAKWSTIHP